MSIYQDILKTITETATEMKDLKQRLYGSGHDQGDIPEIKAQVKSTNGYVQKHKALFAGLPCKNKKMWFLVIVAFLIAILSGFFGGVYSPLP
tara:strand:+ start:569 stop:844 length:276 start_codon:yes stop_codon:yes gene_type:complete